MNEKEEKLVERPVTYTFDGERQFNTFAHNARLGEDE